MAELGKILESAVDEASRLSTAVYRAVKSADYDSDIFQRGDKSINEAFYALDMVGYHRNEARSAGLDLIDADETVFLPESPEDIRRMTRLAQAWVIRLKVHGHLVSLRELARKVGAAT
jgi:hypothetical protein